MMSPSSKCLFICNVTDEKRSGEYLSYRSLEIGTCVPCGDDESLFEMFIHPTTKSPEQRENSTASLEWYLEDFSSNGTIISGAVPPYDADADADADDDDDYDSETVLLQHDRTCIPKSSCLKFVLEIDSHEKLDTDYYVTLDGVIYRQKKTYMNGDKKKIQSETTYLGECSNSTLCDEVTESLLEVDMIVHNQTAFRKRISWAVYDRNLNPDGFKNATVASQEDFFKTKEIQINKTYSSFKCVPNSKCLTFILPDTEDNTEFGIKFNDTIYNDIVLRSKGKEYIEDGKSSKYSIPFGGNCRTSKDIVFPKAADDISTIPIFPGIIAGVAVICLAFAVYKWRMSAATTKNESIVPVSEDK